MGVTYITPVEISLGDGNEWLDADLSSYIASGSTGVLLHIVNASTTTSEYFGYRKNGSTDDRKPYFRYNTHFWIACGVDENRVLEIYTTNTVTIHVYLVGYIDSSAVFNTNATDVSLATANAWTDVDINVDDSAVGALIEVNYISSSSYALGLRKNGSTDNRIDDIRYQHFGFVGVDNDIFEGYVESLATDFYLIGYIKSGVTFNTNATDLSIETTGEYTDLTALPSGATGGIIEIIGNATVYSYALRENGSSEDIYYPANLHAWATVECDISQLIEGKIENTNMDFYLTAYMATPPAFTSITAIKVWNGVEWTTVP